MFKAKLSVPFDELLFSKEKTERKAKAVAAETKKLIDKHFETRQATWKKLSAYTIMRRKAAGYGAGPILIQSGALRKSASEDVTVNSSSDGTTITIISGADYSAKHEYGEGRIPARPFLKMDDKDMERLIKIYFES